MSKKRYPPRIPRTAHGFRPQDLKSLPRGAWWTREWLQAVEKMRLGARAGRGRVYAETGQITSLTVNGGYVEASATGSRPQPYTVKLTFAQLPTANCQPPTSLGAMSLARILAGDMPTAVKEVFAMSGAPLYPTLGVDHFWCSCPDWSHPCKHVVAVLYLLGDAMVRDPSLLLRLRGFPLPCDERPTVPDCPLPLWKGVGRLQDSLARIYRRTGIS